MMNIKPEQGFPQIWVPVPMFQGCWEQFYHLLAAQISGGGKHGEIPGLLTLVCGWIPEGVTCGNSSQGTRGPAFHTPAPHLDC